jgi:hypothetical protein
MPQALTLLAYHRAIFDQPPLLPLDRCGALLTTIATKMCHICFSNDTGKMDPRTVASDW